MASSKQPLLELPRCVLLRENVTRPARFSYQEGFSSLFTLTRKLPGTRGSIALATRAETAKQRVCWSQWASTAMVYCILVFKKAGGCHESHMHPKKIESCLCKMHTDPTFPPSIKKTKHKLIHSSCRYKKCHWFLNLSVSLTVSFAWQPFIPTNRQVFLFLCDRLGSSNLCKDSLQAPLHVDNRLKLIPSQELMPLSYLA